MTAHWLRNITKMFLKIFLNRIKRPMCHSKIWISRSSISNRILKTHITLSHNPIDDTIECIDTPYARCRQHFSSYLEHIHTRIDIECKQTVVPFTRQPDSMMHANRQEQPTLELAFHSLAYCTLYPCQRIQYNKQVTY